MTILMDRTACSSAREEEVERSAGDDTTSATDTQVGHSEVDGSRTSACRLPVSSSSSCVALRVALPVRLFDVGTIAAAAEVVSSAATLVVDVATSSSMHTTSERCMSARMMESRSGVRGGVSERGDSTQSCAGRSSGIDGRFTCMHTIQHVGESSSGQTRAARAMRVE
jgi:hypothetical protein